jgi:hypothetical protein
MQVDLGELIDEIARASNLNKHEKFHDGRKCDSKQNYLLDLRYSLTVGVFVLT